MEPPSRFEVSDDLWAELEPLILCASVAFAIPGASRSADRLVLDGTLYVVHTGSRGRTCLRSSATARGVTAWRRLRDWQAAGVWDALHQKLLEKLNAAGAIDWSRAAVDDSRVRAL